MNEIETVKQETLPIPTQAKAIVVKDEGSLRKANDFFLVIRALKKKIAEVFDPMEEAAKKSKREAEAARVVIVTQREKIEAPLKEGEAYLSGQVSAYDAEVKRKRAEEAKRNEQEALKAEAERRKKEEEQRLAEAAELEAAGLTEEAEELIQETVEETSKPMEVYAAPPSTPKMKLDGMAMVTTWHAEVTDLKDLCLAVGQGRCPLAYVEAKMSALNSQAVSLKGEMRIPGVRAVSQTKPRETGRRAA
jgi:hypothetical protein